MKPVAVDIDTTCRNTANLPKPGGFRVKYRCGSCGELFPYWLTERYPFCCLCGHHIDWSVITHLNSRMSDDIVRSGDKDEPSLSYRYVQLVNDLNRSKHFDGPVFIEEST